MYRGTCTEIVDQRQTMADEHQVLANLRSELCLIARLVHTIICVPQLSRTLSRLVDKLCRTAGKDTSRERYKRQFQSAEEDKPSLLSF